MNALHCGSFFNLRWNFLTQCYIKIFFVKWDFFIHPPIMSTKCLIFSNERERNGLEEKTLHLLKEYFPSMCVSIFGFYWATQLSYDSATYDQMLFCSHKLWPLKGNLCLDFLVYLFNLDVYILCVYMYTQETVCHKGVCVHALCAYCLHCYIRSAISTDYLFAGDNWSLKCQVVAMSLDWGL